MTDCKGGFENSFSIENDLIGIKSVISDTSDLQDEPNLVASCMPMVRYIDRCLTNNRLDLLDLFLRWSDVDFMNSSQMVTLLRHSGRRRDELTEWQSCFLRVEAKLITLGKDPKVLLMGMY